MHLPSLHTLYNHIVWKSSLFIIKKRSSLKAPALQFFPFFCSTFLSFLSFHPLFYQSLLSAGKGCATYICHNSIHACSKKSGRAGMRGQCNERDGGDQGRKKGGWRVKQDLHHTGSWKALVWRQWRNFGEITVNNNQNIHKKTTKSLMKNVFILLCCVKSETWKAG